jgi:hypothetical protein
MNEILPTPSPRPARRRDPREVLDPDRRLLALALLRLGGSRRMAARLAGCAHTTIARTAARDAEFAAKLAEAEGQAAADRLTAPCSAAEEGRLGRAVAWVVRRGVADEVRRRGLVPFCGERVAIILQHFVSYAATFVRAEKLDGYYRLAGDVRQHLQEEVRRAGQTPLGRKEQISLLKSLIADHLRRELPPGASDGDEIQAASWCMNHPKEPLPDSMLSPS